MRVKQVQKNEEGITLIELLLALTILSIVSILIWSVFNKGVEYTNNAITKNQLQQEANILITNLTKIHQSSNEYLIAVNNSCTITVEAQTNKSTEIYNFDSQNICLEVNFTGVIKPIGKDNEFPLDIIVTDKKNKENSIMVNAVLTRLKDY